MPEVNMEARKLYNRIAVLRQEQNISRKELAEKIGMKLDKNNVGTKDFDDPDSYIKNTYEIWKSVDVIE